MNSASRFVHRNFSVQLSDLGRSELFNVTSASRRTKKGDPTSISVSALPVIKREVKNKLTRKELCNLQDYELETYIIELALLDYAYYKSEF